MQFFLIDIAKGVLKFIWKILKFTGIVWLLCGFTVFALLQNVPFLQGATWYGTVIGFLIAAVTIGGAVYTLIQKPEQFATLQDIVLLTPYGFARVDKTPYYKTRDFQI